VGVLCCEFYVRFLYVCFGCVLRVVSLLKYSYLFAWKVFLCLYLSAFFHFVMGVFLVVF